jgi:hypothetical protein
MSIAWYVQRIISAFTSAIKGDKIDVVIAPYTNSQPINFPSLCGQGGIMMSRGIMDYCVEKGFWPTFCT